MLNKRSLGIVLVMAAFGLTACKSSLLGGNDVPPAPEAPPPAAPVSVDGVRTSYADVVEKTSPAVVRITAEHKLKAPAQQQQFPFGDDPLFRQFQIPQQNQGPQIERGLGPPRGAG